MPDIEHTQIKPDIEVVAISGQIVLGRECQRVEWALDRLLKAGKKKVVFDLTNLTHIDSTGVGILITCSGKMSAKGGELRLAGLQPRIAEIMRVAKIDRIIQFYPTTEAATADFLTPNPDR